MRKKLLAVLMTGAMVASFADQLQLFLRNLMMTTS